MLRALSVFLVLTAAVAFGETPAPQAPTPLPILEDVPPLEAKPLTLERPQTKPQMAPEQIKQPEKIVVPPPISLPEPIESRPAPVPPPAIREVVPARQSAPVPLADPFPLPGPTIDPSLPRAEASYSSTYMEMLQAVDGRNRRYFASGIGHSVAASLLSVCLPQQTARERIELLIAMLGEIQSADSDLIRRVNRAGGASFHSELSQIGAQLICKQAGRGVPQTVNALFETFRGTQAEFSRMYAGLRLGDELHNLLAAAILMP